MRRAVEGRFKVVTLETTLPALKVVTVTFLTGFKVRMGALRHSSIASLFTALGVAFTVVATLRVAVVEVLRGRVLRGALGAVAVDLDAVDLRGINSLLRVYPLIIPIKKPLSGFL